MEGGHYLCTLGNEARQNNKWETVSGIMTKDATQTKAVSGGLKQTFLFHRCQVSKFLKKQNILLSYNITFY